MLVEQTLVCQWGQKTLDIEGIAKRALLRVLWVMQALDEGTAAEGEPQIAGPHLVYLWVRCEEGLWERCYQVSEIVRDVTNRRLMQAETAITFWILEGRCVPSAQLLFPNPWPSRV